MFSLRCFWAKAMPKQPLLVFGWNARAWNAVYRALLLNISLPSGVKVLEIGAGRCSAVALDFCDGFNDVTISTYPLSEKAHVDALLVRASRHYPCAPAQSEVYSVLGLTGKYDVIILKSVMGGLFRFDPCAGRKVNEILLGLVRDNLNLGGVVITLDNGCSIFERVISRFGSRRNGWARLRADDFSGAEFVSSFGLLSAFSFGTRFGWLGYCVEDLIYYVDRILNGFVPVRWRCIIGAVYRN